MPPKSFGKMELDISWEEKSVSEKEQLAFNKLLHAGIYQTLILGGGSEDSEIGVVLVDDETIHLLNQTYRGVDRPTDVLSFSMQEKGEGEPDINIDSLYGLEPEELDRPISDSLGDEELYSETKGDGLSVEAIMEEEFLKDDEEDDDNTIMSDDEEVMIYEDTMLGDIVISVERARVQAAEFGHSLEREIVYLAVHGTCHLLGYDHCDDESRVEMRRLEEQVMEKIGLPR